MAISVMATQLPQSPWWLWAFQHQAGSVGFATDDFVRKVCTRDEMSYNMSADAWDAQAYAN